MEDNTNKPKGYYKFGMFYYEENNKRLIVRSPNNRYTLNFANKWSYAIEAIFFIIVILKILVTSGLIH
ncbi:hypothetical protein Mucpa_6131 [Mucilaginibacter paludis DSM 18603]|uniref:DUF5808 domain-containing protein n=1 Tax=Mucilaginibacter paludis DSM 18603 TaxID=714943 RepID=H1YDI0_9SPHI|nr:hypothetical protein Mucpa_6131 [Mucilaginibacter paludis DSM 18603]